MTRAFLKQWLHTLTVLACWIGAGVALTVGDFVDAWINGGWSI